MPCICLIIWGCGKVFSYCGDIGHVSSQHMNIYSRCTLPFWGHYLSNMACLSFYCQSVLFLNFLFWNYLFSRCYNSWIESRNPEVRCLVRKTFLKCVLGIEMVNRICWNKRQALRWSAWKNCIEVFWYSKQSQNSTRNYQSLVILAKTSSVAYEVSGFFSPKVQISESTNLILSHHSNLKKLRFLFSMGRVQKMWYLPFGTNKHLLSRKFCVKNSLVLIQ